MPTPNIARTTLLVDNQISRLDTYTVSARNLEAAYQYLIAEVVMLRLFAIVEHSIAEIAYKICSGARYLNGRVPNVLYMSRSIQGARFSMLNYNRRRPKSNLQWTRSRYIRESVENVLDSGEPYLINANANGNILNEMRQVRNYIAHRNTSSRDAYKRVIRTTFGANLNISVGAFLMSTKRLSTPKIHTYIQQSRIILDDLTRGH